MMPLSRAMDGCKIRAVFANMMLRGYMDAHATSLDAVPHIDWQGCDNDGVPSGSYVLVSGHRIIALKDMVQDIVVTSVSRLDLQMFNVTFNDIQYDPSVIDILHDGISVSMYYDLLYCFNHDHPYILYMNHRNSNPDAVNLTDEDLVYAGFVKHDDEWRLDFV